MYSIFIWLFPHRLVDRPVPIETDREAKLFPSPETGTGQMALRERRIWDGFCPEGTAGFSPGFQPGFNPGKRPGKRSALTRRHVNDALSELHPRSGLQVLKGRKLVWIDLTHYIYMLLSRSILRPCEGASPRVASSRG